jgi:hypothetical protein
MLHGGSVKGVLPKSISASDVGQTFRSAGSGDFPVPGFRVKLSALVREVGKLRNRQARKPALPFGQHALKLRSGETKTKSAMRLRLKLDFFNGQLKATMGGWRVNQAVQGLPAGAVFWLVFAAAMRASMARTQF